MRGIKILMLFMTITVSACCPAPVQVATDYPSPPAELMHPAKTQYLLPPELRKTQPKRPSS